MAAYTVKPAGGGDYSLIQAAVNDHPTDSDFNCYVGNIGSLNTATAGVQVHDITINGIDKDNGALGTTYNGVYVAGNLRFDDALAPYNIVVSDIRIRGANYVTCIVGGYGQSGDGIVIQRCTLSTTATSSSAFIFIDWGQYNYLVVKNCILILQGSNRYNYSAMRLQRAVKFYNNTMYIHVTDAYYQWASATPLDSAFRWRNNLLLASNAAYLTCQGNYIDLTRYDYNIAIDTTLPDGGNNIEGVTEADVVVALDTPWTPKGVALLAGQDLISEGVTDDFWGNPRPAGLFDVGAVQVTAAVTGGPFPHYTRRRMRGGMIGMGL